MTTFITAHMRGLGETRDGEQIIASSLFFCSLSSYDTGYRAPPPHCDPTIFFKKNTPRNWLHKLGLRWVAIEH